MSRSRQAVDAATAASTVEAARAAVDRGRGAGPGSQDPLIGDLRKGGLLPLLVLHFAAREPHYGNQLIARIDKLTGGALTVNPNTMYPLLRSLEAKGLVEGEWAEPDRRSRRYYRTTTEGRAEHDRLLEEVGPRITRIARSIDAIRSELGV
jgi:PadR family transcriptional regulator, regulatory protein PadR